MPRSRTRGKRRERKVDALMFTLTVGTARLSCYVKAPADPDERPSLRRVLAGVRDFADAELQKLGDRANRRDTEPSMEVPDGD